MCVSKLLGKAQGYGSEKFGVVRLKSSRRKEHVMKHEVLVKSFAYYFQKSSSVTPRFFRSSW